MWLPCSGSWTARASFSSCALLPCAGFLSLDTAGVSFRLDSVDTGWRTLWTGAPCALCEAKQPPWPPPTGCWEQPLLAGWQPRPLGLAPHHLADGKGAVTPAEEGVLAPLLPDAFWWVCHSGCGRDFHNACTRWSQLLCLGGCLPGVRERNPLPTPPCSSEASTEHRPGREEQGGDRNVASKPGLLTGGQSVSSGFQLGCSQVEKQLKPEVDASLHLCAT